MKRKCATCWYMSENFCHRYPPTIQIAPDGSLGSIFVPVGDSNFCGEWWLDLGKMWRGLKWDPAKTG